MIGWMIRMAWRDSRGSRQRLSLFVASMVLGVAALVAINSFGANLKRAVDDEAKELLGADLALSKGAAFPDSIETRIAELGGEQSRRTSFASMAYFPRIDYARLATIRANDGLYPFYGAVETDPPEAAETYIERGGALVDRSLMQVYDIQAGDSVRIGRNFYPVLGALLRTPREPAAASVFSPRIYVPIAGLDSLLLDRGSRAEYEVYFRFQDGRDVEALGDSLRPEMRESRVGVDTVGEERDDWNEALSNLYRFLGLVGFVALLLGSLGVASSVHVYVSRRIDTVAVLRCFGASSWQTFGIYGIQALAMGLTGALVGAALGVAIQLLIPIVLAGLLPVDVQFSIDWAAVATGTGVGVSVTILFALLPLLAVRRVPPLRAIRSSVEPERGADLATWIVRGVVAVGVIGLAMIQAPTPLFGLGYAAAVAAVFLALTGVAWLLIRVAKRWVPDTLPYVARQGLANLHRPANQTLLLMLSLGFGTFLIGTLFIMQQTLLNQVEVSDSSERPNLVMYDIQPDQVAGVEQALLDRGLPVIDRVPIVTMRLQSVKGRSVADIRSDSTREGPRWPFVREYRSTYRDSLTDSETLVEGAWTVASQDDMVPVSAEADIASDLGVSIGDTLVWDVQGVPIPSRVTSIRTVDWRRLQTNFFFVFPPGVLEQAPQFNVVLSRANSDSLSAAAQAAVVRTYPNVSAVDLSLVLEVVEAVFSRISFVVRFMALFSVLTGLIVLAGSVVVSRMQRIGEAVLLKTLGASKKQVVRITIVEYLALGIMAASTGLLLSIACGWALAQFIFDTPLALGGVFLPAMALLVVGVVLLIGTLSSRGVYRKQPLEVLRAET